MPPPIAARALNKLAEIMQVDPTIGTAYRSGSADTLKGAVRGVANSGRMPFLGKVGLTAVVMYCLYIKNGFDSDPTWLDNKSKPKSPEEQSPSETQEQEQTAPPRKPNAFAKVITGGGLWARPERAQSFIINLCVALSGIAALAGNAPIVENKFPAVKSALQGATKFVFGPVLGLIEMLGLELLTSSVVAAGEGAAHGMAAGATSRGPVGLGLEPNLGTT